MNLYITEKPTVSRMILEQIKSDNDLFSCSNSFMYKFDYSNFEANSNPKYSFKTPMFDIQKTINGELVSLNDKFNPETFTNKYDIEKFDTIVMALDPDHAGIRATDLILKHFKIKDTSKIKYFDVYGKRELDFFNNNFINSCRTKYLKKDYVDYNFNGYIKNHYGDYDFITRNMLWSLIVLSKYSNTTLNINHAYNIIEKFDIGSAASRATILNILNKHYFLDQNYHTTGKTMILFDDLNINKDAIYYLHDIQNEINSNSPFDNKFIEKANIFFENTIII